MGLPVVVASTLASIAVDGASFTWGTWETTKLNFGVERWNINVVMGATTATLFMDQAVSANGTVFATAALNLNASIAVGALYGISVDVIRGTFYNFHWGATTTVKSFYVVASTDEAVLT